MVKMKMTTTMIKKSTRMIRRTVQGHTLVKLRGFKRTTQTTTTTMITS